MKVSELIAKLSKLEQGLDVLCYTEEESLLNDGHGFRVLEIEDVDTTSAERVRMEDGSPTLKLIAGPNSSQFVFLHVTSDY